MGENKDYEELIKEIKAYYLLLKKGGSDDKVELNAKQKILNNMKMALREFSALIQIAIMNQLKEFENWDPSSQRFRDNPSLISLISLMIERLENPNALKELMSVDLPEDKEALWNLAYNLYNERKFKESARAYKKYVKLYDEKEAWCNLGFALRFSKQYDEAIKVAKECLQIDPEYTAALDLLGALYLDINKPEEAVEPLKKAVKIDPTLEFAWHELGAAYMIQEQFSKAIECLQKTIELNPNSVNAFIDLATSYTYLPDYKDAVKFSNKAIDLDEDNAKAWNAFGWANAKLGKFDEALTGAGRAVDIDPKLFEGWHTLGYAYNGLEEYDRGIDCFKKAISLNPEYPDSWFDSAFSYLKLGDPKKAYQSVIRCLEINPNFPGASGLKETIEQELGIKETILDINSIINKLDQYYSKLTDEKLLPAEEHAYKTKLISMINSLKRFADKINMPIFDKALDLLDNFEPMYGSFKENKEVRKIVKKILNIYLKEEKLKKKAIDYILRLPQVYGEVTFAKIMKRTDLSIDAIEHIIEELIFDGKISAQIKGNTIYFSEMGATPRALSNQRDQEGLQVLRGGDWKIEGNHSTFFYKVKVKNNSSLVIANIQIILTSIPRGLQADNDRYKIDLLRPGAYESPSFKLRATESCVGDIIEGTVIYLDPSGTQKSILIEPFEICYVCNLLTPKEISKKEFDEKVEFMEDQKLVIESDLTVGELETRIASIVKNCNFALLQQLKENKREDFTKLEAFAEGLYDKQDVALSIAIKEVKHAAKKGAKKGSKKGTKLVVRAMSERSEKLMDILKDLNVQLDDIKSDTELIKEYTSQIEEIFDKVEDLEDFLIQSLGSDFAKIKHAWQDFKAGKITKGGLIKEGLKIIGKKFVKKIVKKIII